MQTNVPCIALIEDIDNVFNGREYVARRNFGYSMMFDYDNDDDEGESTDPNKKKKKKGGRGGLLSFNVLLNCLDGVEKTDGTFVIVTTNDLSKVDEALGKPTQLPDGTKQFISTRPGRIDKAIELTYMETNDKKKMAQRILGMYEKEYLEMLVFIDKFTDLLETPAQFQERCAQLALACYWKELDAEKRKQSQIVALYNGNGNHSFPEVATEVDAFKIDAANFLLTMGPNNGMAKELVQGALRYVATHEEAGDVDQARAYACGYLKEKQEELQE